MKVALFDPATGACVRVMSRALGRDREGWNIGENLAWDARYWGAESRVLDGTPFADRLAIAAVPDLVDFDAAVIAAGGSPQPFTAPEEPPPQEPEEPSAG